jgi:hypothetical protein
MLTGRFFFAVMGYYLYARLNWIIIRLLETLGMLLILTTRHSLSERPVGSARITDFA